MCVGGVCGGVCVRDSKKRKTDKEKRGKGGEREIDS